MAMRLALAMAEDMPVAVQPPCRECRWAACRYRTAKIRAYLIAYREAVKCGDDPAEWIRDSIKPSRRPDEAESRPQQTDALTRSTRPQDGQWHVDIKIALEEARAAGLSLDAWNAEAVARWFCVRANELPIDSDARVDGY